MMELSTLTPRQLKVSTAVYYCTSSTTLYNIYSPHLETTEAGISMFQSRGKITAVHMCRLLRKFPSSPLLWWRLLCFSTFD